MSVLCYLFTFLYISHVFLYFRAWTGFGMKFVIILLFQFSGVYPPATPNLCHTAAFIMFTLKPKIVQSKGHGYNSNANRAAGKNAPSVSLNQLRRAETSSGFRFPLALPRMLTSLAAAGSVACTLAPLLLWRKDFPGRVWGVKVWRKNEEQ